jgi:hypothetical protein
LGNSFRHQRQRLRHLRQLPLQHHRPSLRYLSKWCPHLPHRLLRRRLRRLEQRLRLASLFPARLLRRSFRLQRRQVRRRQ